MFSRKARTALYNSRKATKQSPLMAQPYYQGDAAWHAGVKRSECPLTGNDAEEWVEGWNTAQDDAEARDIYPRFVPFIDKV